MKLTLVVLKVGIVIFINSAAHRTHAQHVLTIHFYFNSIYEELKSLRVKVIALEHDLHKSCQKASKNHDLCYQLEKEYDVSGIPLVIFFLFVYNVSSLRVYLN
ncbi:hypothetical protein NC651_026866 [Populus alba x Populus x berolinensis]|nr:hypothetical protein NC651_026866 [Populus alba x Populus x berolinensis]